MSAKVRVSGATFVLPNEGKRMSECERERERACERDGCVRRNDVKWLVRASVCKRGRHEIGAFSHFNSQQLVSN